MLHQLAEYRGMIEHIASQIPAALLPTLKLRVRSDAFGIAPTLIVTDARGREWCSLLKPGFTVGDEFLAWLCVVE
jgi:hypothetical protein